MKNSLMLVLLMASIFMSVNSNAKPISHNKKVSPVTHVSKVTKPNKKPKTSKKKSSKIIGNASFYGYESGPRTASGKPFIPSHLTAAHKTLPFGSKVEVVNLENHKSVTVTINDRGPFVKGRIIDLSKGAAKKIGMTGVQKVSLTVIK